jgi:hypothetical protein
MRRLSIREVDKVKLFVYFVCEVGSSSWGRIEFTIEDVMHPCDRRSAELFLLRNLLVSSVDPAFLPLAPHGQLKDLVTDMLSHHSHGQFGLNARGLDLA